MTTCPDCAYLQAERAAIHEYDGKATRQQAEQWAKGERCGKHATGKETAPITQPGANGGQPNSPAKPVVKRISAETENKI